MMSIVLVEDDHRQRAAYAKAIKRQFPSYTVQLVRTEKEFRDKLAADWVRNPPSLFVIDVMLRWTDPHPHMEIPPDDVLPDGSRRAGIRCAKLARRRLGPNPQIILVSVLEENAEENRIRGVRYVRKGTSVEPIVHVISSLL
jgi:hypothetical protein